MYATESRYVKFGRFFKVPIDLLEAVNRRRTNNTMDKETGQKEKQLSTKHYTYNSALRYLINSEIYSPYGGADGMLLHICICICIKVR